MASTHNPPLQPKDPLWITYATPSEPKVSNFVSVVKKDLKTKRYIHVTKEDRYWLATVAKDRVLLDKSKVEENRSKWRNLLVGKFLGSNITLSFLKDKINSK